jgi:hypothetical protein
MVAAVSAKHPRQGRVGELLCKHRLTNRSSGRVIDKVPSPNGNARGAQLNR